MLGAIKESHGYFLDNRLVIDGKTDYHYLRATSLILDRYLYSNRTMLYPSKASNRKFFSALDIELSKLYRVCTSLIGLKESESGRIPSPSRFEVSSAAARQDQPLVRCVLRVLCEGYRPSQ